MINYSNNKNLNKMIQIEIDSLSSTLDIQKNLYVQLLTFMKTFMSEINVNEYFEQDNKIQTYITDCVSEIKNSNKNIESLNSLLKTLNKLTVSHTKKDIEKYNTKFNKEIESIYKKTSSIQSFIHEISMVDFSQYIKETKTNDNKNVLDKTIVYSDEIDDMFLENTLVVSDTQKKVILPYDLKTVTNILKNSKHKYSSIQDVIDKLYTRPISDYRFSSVARFKEAYNLVTIKEHGSKTQALKLAFELFSNYNLHPAIISACNSLDDLDVYLACLHDNTLDDFKIFNIKYEVAPATL